MSLNGSAEGRNALKGSAYVPDAIHGKSAYEIAVMHGFDGTEEEWLESLKADFDERADEAKASIDAEVENVIVPEAKAELEQAKTDAVENAAAEIADAETNSLKVLGQFTADSKDVLEKAAVTADEKEVLLWENNNTNDAFVSQTISIKENLTDDVESIRIVFLDQAGCVLPGINVKRGQSGRVSYSDGFTGSDGELHARARTRLFTFNDAGTVSFEGADPSNAYCKPYRIYGVKNSAINIPQLMDEIGVTVGVERDRAIARENEIESLFTMPTQEAVDHWLDEHPEATTTVQDHSLTIDKMVVGTLNYVTPEMFGAVGDGVTDDSTAIQNAMNAGRTVLMRGTYGVGSTITASAQKVIGDGAKIVLLNDLDYIFVLNSANHISGLSFDCKNHGVMRCISVTATDSVEICDIRVHDVKDMRTDKISNLIFVLSVPTVNIHDVTIENCLHIANGTIGDSGGAIYGIYVNHNEKHCTIQNVVGKEIHNIDADGNIVFEDSGLIYINSVYKEAGTFMRNISGYNYGKRLIKTQCNNPIVIDGVEAYTNAVDHLAAIAIGSRGDGSEHIASSVISNCVLENACETQPSNQDQSLIATSEKTIVSNCKLISPYHPSFLNTGDMTISNCEVEGVGITNSGRTLKVDNVHFDGTYFLSTYDKSKMTEETFTNCTMNYVEGGGKYSEKGIVFNAPSSRLANSVVNGCKITIQQGNNTMHGVKMTGSLVDTLWIKSGTADIRDVSICNESETEQTRFLLAEAGTSVSLKNLTTNGFKYAAVFKGDTDIRGGVDLTKLHTVNATTFNNIPEYVATLPYKGECASGMKVILLTDNKLYTMTDGSWVAV